MSSIDKLQTRAFGGEDVATRPDAIDDQWWPSGPLLPGVKEMIVDLAARPPIANGLSIYFLLGGAGNGKSFAARAVAKRLRIDLASSSGKLARRKYERSLDGADIVILNDATIAESEHYGENAAIALATDIAGWFERARTRPVIAFCCVNRGIVVDEIRALEVGGHDSPEVARRVLQWIAGNRETISSPGEEALKDFRSPLGLGPHYRESASTIDQVDVRAFSLSVDATSVVSVAPNGGEGAARKLAGQISSLCWPDVEGRGGSCPLRANLANLSDARYLEGWGRILEGAEAASGHYFSYRDLWGIIALSVCGPRSPSGAVEASGVLGAIDELVARLDASSNVRERLQCLLDLSKHRLSCALFRAPVPRLGVDEMEFPPGTPFHAGLALVDPALWGASGYEKIESAMNSIALGEKPSLILKQMGLELNELWQPFDDLVEDAVLEFASSPGFPDSYRRGLVSWLSGYIMRLCSLGPTGIGNQREIEVLKECALACEAGPALPPASIDDGLRRLLFPEVSQATAGRVVTKALAPRSEPLGEQAGQVGAVLGEVTSVGTLSLRLRRRNDRVLLEVNQTGQERSVGELTVDLPLIRQALAWSHGRIGQTDASRFVEPRLERCRASSLAALPPSMRRLVAVTRSGQVELAT